MNAPARSLLAAALLAAAAGCGPRSGGLGTAAFAGFEARCENLPAARFEVVTAPVEVREDYSLAYVELEKLADASAPRHRTVGLTQAKFGYRSTLEFEGIEDPRSGRVCARARVRVEVTTAPMTVFVAREYRGDPCREPIIIEHERRHVAVFETYAAEWAERLASELNAKVGGAIRYAPTMADAQTALKTEIAAHLEAFMDRARSDLAERHARIDTRYEYEKLVRVCG
ncbi:MAG: hypothetical protein U1F51_18165 [Burkholderiales bacterium]